MRAEELVLKPQRCLEMLAEQLAKGEARPSALRQRPAGRTAPAHSLPKLAYATSAIYTHGAGRKVLLKIRSTQNGRRHSP
jgi:hypothetical protein